MGERGLMTRDPHEGIGRSRAPMISEEGPGRPWNARDAYPYQVLPVIVERAGEEETLLLQWGLVPHWLRPGGKRANCPTKARSETMFECPMFRELARFRRCIVRMSGYYEWHPDESGKKRQYYIAARDGERWEVAGLWDGTRWAGSEAAGSFALLTMPATPLVARIHPRMLVILRRNHRASWLSPDVTDARDIRRLVQPYPESAMRIDPVGDSVGARRNNGPELTAPRFTQSVLW